MILKPIKWDRQAESFANAVLSGLQRQPKKTDPKHLYDKKGSELFERICETPEYYPTRTEMRILRERIQEISELVGPGCAVYEPGSGSSLKTRILLKGLDQPKAYFPVDISEEFLLQSSRKLEENFPELVVQPICGDFMSPRRIESADWVKADRRLVFFPGSTIGNLEPHRAITFLRQLTLFLEEGDFVLLGVDLVKDVGLLESAYNDSENWTAKFNLNLLRRVRDELRTDIRIDNFEHLARFNSKESRIEMHLKSRVEQKIQINGSVVRFKKGETIHTENSYKYRPEEVSLLGSEAGMKVNRFWTDSESLFGVFLLEVHSIPGTNWPFHLS